MSGLFKLIEEEFSQVDKEWQWTYSIQFQFIFNNLTINKITKKLILELLTKINGEILEPMEYNGTREPCEWETIHNFKPYRLFFWFKDGTDNHLWIRNCHEQD